MLPALQYSYHNCNSVASIFTHLFYAYIFLAAAEFFVSMLNHIKDPTSAKWVYPSPCDDLQEKRGCKLLENSAAGELYDLGDVYRLEKNSTVNNIDTWPKLSELLEDRAGVLDQPASNITAMYEIEYLAREYGDKVLDAPNASAAEEMMKTFVQHGLQRRLTMKDADVDCATAAYLLYIGLLVSSMLLIIFGFVTHFVAKGMKRKSPRTQLRIFGMLAGLSILGMW
jgi:hypothetical protein